MKRFAKVFAFVSSVVFIAVASYAAYEFFALGNAACTFEDGCLEILQACVLALSCCIAPKGLRKNAIRLRNFPIQVAGKLAPLQNPCNGVFCALQGFFNSPVKLFDGDFCPVFGVFDHIFNSVDVVEDVRAVVVVERQGAFAC